MNSGGWEQLIDTNTNIWDDIRRGVEGLENEGGRGWKEERRKIKTEGQQLAGFECGRVFTWRSATRQMCVRERAHNVGPGQAKCNRVYFQLCQSLSA